MSVKQKVLKAMTAHPKLFTFTIGLAITMTIASVIGTLDSHEHLAYAGNALGRNRNCYG